VNPNFHTRHRKQAKIKPSPKPNSIESAKLFRSG
ncbi:hypothetical protein CDAR_417491, partial [Caerostris darwini]